MSLSKTCDLQGRAIFGPQVHNLNKLERFTRFCSLHNIKVRKTAKIRNQYNQVPHLTQDTTWDSDKNTIKHHKALCIVVSDKNPI